MKIEKETKCIILKFRGGGLLIFLFSFIRNCYLYNDEKRKVRGLIEENKENRMNTLCCRGARVLCGMKSMKSHENSF